MTEYGGLAPECEWSECRESARESREHPSQGTVHLCEYHLRELDSLLAPAGGESA